MQYLFLIHGNTPTDTSSEEWGTFFEAARASGLFQGGSALGKRELLGNQSATPTGQIAGYMRFDAEDKQQILDLLQLHPVIKNGGSGELCEMPKS